MKDQETPVTTLDVRLLIAKGEEPLPHILHAAAALQDGTSLKLLAPFEPLPLYIRMDTMGFNHQTEKISDDPDPLWQILFTKKESPASIPSTGLRQLDIRSTPPDTAATIINDELHALAYDDVLKVIHHNPLPLQPDPTKYQTNSQTKSTDGSAVTRIWRRS